MKKLTFVLTLVSMFFLGTSNANTQLGGGPNPFGPCVTQPVGVGGPSIVNTHNVSSASFFTSLVCNAVSYHWFYKDSAGFLWAEATTSPFSSVPIPEILRAGNECGTFTVEVRALIDDGINLPYRSNTVSMDVTVTGCGS